MFGQYADRRLMIAALDTVSAAHDERLTAWQIDTPEEHASRAEKFRSLLQPDEEGGVWIDWIADLGDGFESTYAVASVRKLNVGRPQPPSFGEADSEIATTLIGPPGADLPRFFPGKERQK